MRTKQIRHIGFRGGIKILFLFMLLSVFPSLRGQAVPDEDGINLVYPVYSQYLQNGLMINPAYTGTRGSLSTFLSYRKQWIGTPGSPVIQSVSLHTPMKNDKVALGLMAQFMQYGATRSTSIYANYAYHIKMGKGKLSFGLKGGADLANTSYSESFKATLSDYGTFVDDLFETGDKYVLGNVGAGVYYFTDKIFAGVSVPSFLSYRKTVDGKVQPYHSFSKYDFVFSGGGLITFSQFFKFKPSVLIDFAPDKANKINQLDINGNFILADFLWIGGSWRTTEEVAVGILQIQANPRLMFGFSYDYPFGRMNSYSSGSTEFIIRYEFGTKVSAANPRYF